MKTKYFILRGLLDLHEDEKALIILNKEVENEVIEDVLKFVANFDVKTQKGEILKDRNWELTSDEVIDSIEDIFEKKHNVKIESVLGLWNILEYDYNDYFDKENEIDN